MGEGCKIGYCDEYDFRVEFYNINLSSQLKDNTGIDHVTKVCNAFQPPLLDSHPLFVKSGKAFCNKDIADGLTLLGCDDNATVPWVLLSWKRHSDPPNEWSLIKVDRALTIPCPGVWPGDKKVDPLGGPITQLGHLMLPHTNHPKDYMKNKWRWSVYAAQQSLFQTLPKYAHLGYMICKIICSDTLFPEPYKPPSTFCLKNYLFNALANNEIDINDPTAMDNADCLILQAIQVADVIVAGLQKSQFGYFCDGEPVEHVRVYLPSCNGFMAQHLLHILANEYVNILKSQNLFNSCNKHNQLDVQQSIPHTFKLINKTYEKGDFEMIRDILGLRSISMETDTLQSIAMDGSCKWQDRIPWEGAWNVERRCTFHAYT